MNLQDIVGRQPVPDPWAEGDNIPWNEPGFSARMLAEHLSQEHDAASRRAIIVDRQVSWIYGCLLDGRPSRVLDLGCGPGLYASRLARLGCECTGIDFSPASIAYARRQAAEGALACRYVEADLRGARFGDGYDLAMLLYGELNVFSPDDAHSLLARAAASLRSNGVLLLEPHTYEAVRDIGGQGAAWWSSSGGLFSARPHLVLAEHVWDGALGTATKRYYVVDAEAATVERHASTMQAYTEDEYAQMLAGAGLVEVAFHASLTGDPADAQQGLVAITARRP